MYINWYKYIISYKCSKENSFLDNSKLDKLDFSRNEKSPLISR